MGHFRLILFSILVTCTSVWAKPLYLSYEQRVILSYALAGTGESQEVKNELFGRLISQIEAYQSKAIVETQVSSFEDFLKQYRGEWPNSHSLDKDLELFEKAPSPAPKKWVAKTPELQNQIEGFIQAQNKMLVEKISLGTRNPQIQDFSQLSIYNKASDFFLSQIQNIEDISNAVSTDMISKDNKDPVTKLIPLASKEYFKRLDLSSKKQIINLFLGNDLNASGLKKFELMIAASGPQFQKLLQILARQSGISPSMLKVFKQLESSVQPVPEPLVRELFESEKENYNWLSYELKPIGTGTMAQVHKGLIATEFGPIEVVIRFLKPDIEKRVHEDHRILSEIAPIIDKDPSLKNTGVPKIEPLVDDLDRTVRDELSLKDTIQRQNDAFLVYNNKSLENFDSYKNYVEFEVPKVIKGKDESKLHVQQLMPGSKLDKTQIELGHLLPDLKQKVVESVAKMWTEEALFKSGFFHSDLHQGNFLVDFSDERIRISILDFGMGGYITTTEQRNMLLLGAGIRLKNPEIIGQALWNLSDKENNKIKETDFFVSVNKNIHKDLHTNDQWTSWSITQGLRFSYTFLGLMRGMTILNKSLEEAGSSMNIDEIAIQLIKKHPLQTFSDLKKFNLIKSSEFIELGLQTYFETKQKSGHPVQCKILFAR